MEKVKNWNLKIIETVKIETVRFGIRKKGRS